MQHLFKWNTWVYESQLWLGLRQKDINHIEAFINDVPAEDSEDISLDLDQTSGPSLQSAALTYYMWSVTNTVSLLLFSLSLDRTFALQSQKIKKICKGLKSQLCLSLKGINTCLIQWHHFSCPHNPQSSPCIILLTLALIHDQCGSFTSMSFTWIIS